ncbi:MAG: hypothetical protein A2506_03435, partial [Elusimicrobia bacterium RIFOXYD12_FULL_66_9]
MTCNISDLLRPQLDGPGANLLDAHEVRAAWKKHLAGGLEAPRHLYLHIPFCRQRCSYCCYYSVPSGGGPAVEEYLASLHRAMRFFAPVFAKTPFQTLYIGGGTPSLLTPDQMTRLLEAVYTLYRFEDGGQRTVECNPLSVTKEKLAVLEKSEINRISMGVQSLNRTPLASENRGYQDAGSVGRAVRLVREAGDFRLNLDLLLGMKTDDGKSFLRTFDAIMRLEPDEVTVYTITPMNDYLEKFYSGDPALFRAHLRDRFKEVPLAVRDQARARIHLTQSAPSLDDHAWHFSGGARQSRFNYDDFSPEPASVLGLGPSSRSRAAGVLAYTENIRLPALFDPKKKVYRARRLTLRDEMVKFLVVRICNDIEGVASRFAETFGVEIEAAFPAEVEALREDGLLTGSGARLAFRPRSADERGRCAAGFAAPRGLTLVFPSGRCHLRVEPLRYGRRYLAQTGDLGLLASEEGSLGPRPLARRRLLAALFLKAANVRPAAGARDVADEYARLLEEVAPTLGAQAR